MTYDAAAIVKKYIELRDYVQARTKEMEKTGGTERDQELIKELRIGSMFSEDVRALVEEAATRLEQLLTPLCQYKEAMELLEAAAHAMMKETKQEALSTEFGTAFKVPKLSVTCTDKEAFHAWVRKVNGWGFLTAHVSKEAVEDWMELHGGQIPPGVKVEGYVAVQFRRA